MSAERQTPGGSYVNETGTAQRQVPGGEFVNETVAAAGGNSIAVPAASLVLAGFAPSITNPNALAIPAGSLTFSAFAPVVSASAGNSVSVPAGSLVFSGFAPSVTFSGANSISVPRGTLTFSALAPTVTGIVVTASTTMRVRLRPINLPQNQVTAYDRRLSVMLYDYLREISLALNSLSTQIDDLSTRIDDLELTGDIASDSQHILANRVFGR